MKSIHKKLLLIRAEIGAIAKTKINPHFKNNYFDINILLEHLDPLLENANILLLQPIVGDKLYTRLIDVDTGEEEAGYVELDHVDNPQRLGSMITYYRRYSLTSLLGIQGEDDDGNAASNGVVKKKQWLTEEQFKIALKATPKQIIAVLEKYDGKDCAMKREYREALEEQLDKLTNAVIKADEIL